MDTQPWNQPRQFKGLALNDTHEKIETQDVAQSEHRSDDGPRLAAAGMRPVWIILFAAILILICTKSKADESVVSRATLTVELNGEVHVITPATVKPVAAVELNQRVSDSGVRPANWVAPVDSRPQNANLSAQLANFDADADPDGWRAEVILFDRHDRPVSARGQASFELTPRIPTGDYHLFIDANTKPITWSEELHFDADGVARFRLPLRQPLQPSFSWASANDSRSSYGRSNLRHAGFTHRSSIYRSGHRSGINFGNQPRILGATVTRDIRSNLGKPEFGELRVKVSVPGVGVFNAVSVVPIRPTVLVDTHWPYR